MVDFLRLLGRRAHNLFGSDARLEQEDGREKERNLLCSYSSRKHYIVVKTSGANGYVICLVTNLSPNTNEPRGTRGGTRPHRVSPPTPPIAFQHVCVSACQSPLPLSPLKRNYLLCLDLTQVQYWVPSTRVAKSTCQAWRTVIRQHGHPRDFSQSQQLQLR
jgi:hypothetical protein